VRKLEGCWRGTGRSGNTDESVGTTLTGALLCWEIPRRWPAIHRQPKSWRRSAALSQGREDRPVDRISEEDRGCADERLGGARDEDIAGAIVEQRRKIQQCRRELKKLTKDHKPIQSQALAVGLTTACVLWMCLAIRSSTAAPAPTARRWAEPGRALQRDIQGKLKLSKRGRGCRESGCICIIALDARAVGEDLLENKKRAMGRGGKAATGIMRSSRRGMARGPGRSV